MKEQFEYRNLQCLMHQNENGDWCAYVGVSETHPAYGRDHQSIKDNVFIREELTHSAKCEGEVCHPGEDNVWWLGFNCSKWPNYRESKFWGTKLYQDKEYVRLIAKQLASHLSVMKAA